MPRLPSKAHGERKEGRMEAGGTHWPAPPLPCPPSPSRPCLLCPLLSQLLPAGPARASAENPSRPHVASITRPGDVLGICGRGSQGLRHCCPRPRRAPGRVGIHGCLTVRRPLPRKQAARCVLSPHQAGACPWLRTSAPGLAEEAVGWAWLMAMTLTPRRKEQGAREGLTFSCVDDGLVCFGRFTFPLVLLQQPPSPQKTAAMPSARVCLPRPPLTNALLLRSYTPRPICGPCLPTCQKRWALISKATHQIWGPALAVLRCSLAQPKTITPLRNSESAWRGWLSFSVCRECYV